MTDPEATPKPILRGPAPRKPRTTKPKHTRTRPDQIIRKGKDGALWLRLPKSVVEELSATVDWLATLSIGSDFAESLLLEEVVGAGVYLRAKASGKLQRALAGSQPDVDASVADVEARLA
jgi:hypothetical protein